MEERRKNKGEDFILLIVLVCVFQLFSGNVAMNCRTLRELWLKLNEERQEFKGGSVSRKPLMPK